jgi:hypothetical protein
MRKSPMTKRQRAKMPMPWQRGHWPAKDSVLWPECCRGEKWRLELAILYVGKCHMCMYASQPSKGQQFFNRKLMLPTYLLCTNHPDSPGQLRDVMDVETCRNFRLKPCCPARSRKPRKELGNLSHPSDVRQIALGHGRFAIVDAADFERLNKYKWCVSNKQGTVYAMRRTKDGKTIYMHREVAHASKGEVVDHADHNTLNNRSGNVRACTSEQNYANAGPRGGASGFVGVYLRDGNYEAGITCRGKHYYLGKFPDAVSAAKARDRKAYELHGPYAYLNFPEEIKKEFAAAAKRKA